MKTRMVALGVVWFAGVGAGLALAGDPPALLGRDAEPFGTSLFGSGPSSVSPFGYLPATPASPAAKAKAAATAEATAKTRKVAADLGLTFDELKRLHELGFCDAEVQTLVVDRKYTARQLITQREVVNEICKTVEEVSPRVFQLSGPQQSAERDRALKATLAKIRHDRKIGKDELRQILNGTSLFTPDEMNRLIGGPSFFRVDELKRVIFSEEPAKAPAR